MLLHCKNKTLDLSRPNIMGILNVTPDSFSDGGDYLDPTAAIEHGRNMINEGADIIDVGGESTRPDADPVSTEEELERVVPVVEALAKSPAVISVDTSSPEVMLACVDAGAGFINDVRALSRKGALEAAVGCRVPVCLMHMLGDPKTMQKDPSYNDVVAEVTSYLQERKSLCVEAGISSENVLIDPGFGFGKTVAHNLALLRNLKSLEAVAAPILVGLSRKSMLQRITGKPAGQRLYGSLALAVMAVANGANIVRVHDVAQTVDVMKVYSSVADA